VEGGSIEVPTLDGKVRVKVPPGAANGRRLRVRGKGLGEGSARGDLLLELRPTVPARPDPEAVRLAAQLDAFYDDEVRAGLVL
jgi:molecular chaperone DnaJ